MKLLPVTGRYSYKSQVGEKVVHFWQHSTIISNLSSLPEDIDGLQQEKPSCLLLSQATTKAVKLKIHTSTNWWQVFISAQATLFSYLWPQEIDIIFLKSAPCHPQENFFCPAYCSLLTLRHQLAYEQINQLSHVEKASDRKVRNLLSQDKHSTSLGLSSAPRARIQSHLHDKTISDEIIKAIKPNSRTLIRNIVPALAPIWSRREQPWRGLAAILQLQ